MQRNKTILFSYSSKFFSNYYNDRDHSDYLPLLSSIPVKNRYDTIDTYNDTHTITYSVVVKRPVKSSTLVTLIKISLQSSLFEYLTDVNIMVPLMCKYQL